MLTTLIVPLLAAALQAGDPAAAQDAEVAVAAGDGDPALALPPDAPRPAAYHLGSFGSWRAARLGLDGSLDSGAAVLRLLDGAGGAPLSVQDLRFGDRPHLVAGWQARLGDVDVRGQVAAVPLSRQGDERVKAVLRLTLSSAATEARAVRLAARLSPGGGDPLQRPHPSLPFVPGGAWTLEDGFVTRDGRAVLGWTGVEPEVALAVPAGPDDEAARLTWSFELQPGAPRLIELYLLGPPAATLVEEAAIREGALRWGYLHAEEQLDWQSRERGAFADIQLHDARLWYALVGSLHTLRLLGKAADVPEGFSDRPFGHPASDGAVDAEAIGLFAEWAFGDWAAGFHKRLLSEVAARGAALSAERRVALLHGLARSVRLGSDAGDQQALAAAIRALLGPEAEGVPVRPWLDPELVRRDLQSVLDDAGAGQGFELPRLAWAPVPAGSRAAALQAARRAISARRGGEAWAQLAPLVAGTDSIGQGSLEPGGVPDFGFCLGLASLLREMLIDDHGAELHLFPGLAADMVPRRLPVQTTVLPTRYGPTHVEQFRIKERLLGLAVSNRGARVPAAILLHVADGLQPAAAVGPLGGRVTLRDDGLVDCWIDPRFPKGLRFNVKLAGEP